MSASQRYPEHRFREPNYDRRDRRYDRVNGYGPRRDRYDARPCYGVNSRKRAQSRSPFSPVSKRQRIADDESTDFPSSEVSVSVPSFGFDPSAVKVSDEETNEEGEITEVTEVSSSSPSSVSVTVSTDSSTSSVPEAYYYADILRDTEVRLSDRCFDAEVRADKRSMYQYYSTEDTAYQYDWRIQHVRNMLRFMYVTYNTVAVYSLNLLRAGDIIYYLEAFPIGLHQRVEGKNAAYVGGRDCNAAVKLKGRFAIVLDVFGQHVKVAELATFNNKGLAVAKSQKYWHEYAGIRSSDDVNYQHPSQAINKPLEVGFSCCEIPKTTSVHLITSRISLSNQIMIAGNITSDSLGRLRTSIRKLESRGSR